MATLRPFRGVRPKKEWVRELACPPYDVIDSKEARQLAHGNAQSFLRITRPEVDLPPSIDEHAPEVYRKGADNLAQFLKQGLLRTDAEPQYYLYAQHMGSHRQIGVVGLASVAEYLDGRIKKHELTRADKEEDRTRHIDALGANDEPVFLAYRARADIDAWVAAAASKPPAYDFSSDDGIRHVFWTPGPSAVPELSALFAAVPQLYIADGHHRSAAAARVAAMRRGKPGSHDGFLSVVFPHNQLQILDYNRLLKSLGRWTVKSLIERLGQDFEVSESSQEVRPLGVREFGMYVADQWYRLKAKPESVPTSAVGRLDVAILQSLILGPVFDIDNPRTDERIAFVGGVRGYAPLVGAVDGGKAAVAFTLFPTKMEQLFEVADASDIMPPKSTWFEPKLRSGLVLHLFQP